MAFRRGWAPGAAGRVTGVGDPPGRVPAPGMELGGNRQSGRPCRVAEHDVGHPLKPCVVELSAPTSGEGLVVGGRCASRNLDHGLSPLHVVADAEGGVPFVAASGKGDHVDRVVDDLGDGQRLEHRRFDGTTGGGSTQKETGDNGLSVVELEAQRDHRLIGRTGQDDELRPRREAPSPGEQRQRAQSRHPVPASDHELLDELAVGIGRHPKTMT